LLERAPKSKLAQVVGDIGGAQAQVMSLAELQIAVRVSCNVEDVREALWKKRSLVKTWLMRGTLHLIPSADLPMFAAAMGAHGLRNLNTWLKYLQVDEAQLTKLFDGIGSALNGWPGVGTAAWKALDSKLVTVSVEGQKAQMLGLDLKLLPKAPSPPSVQLLPGFDPYLMGHATRDHLFDKAHRWKVSRVAGWISP